MEAMACGLPVVVTDNCGVPVPVDTWRVPVMNATAIAERLHHYLEDRELLRLDAVRAVEFARCFTPARYRAAICRVFTQTLSQGGN
jgi:glycosyltransferase involved in cell wall biosynthesis